MSNQQDTPKDEKIIDTANLDESKTKITLDDFELSVRDYNAFKRMYGDDEFFKIMMETPVRSLRLKIGSYKTVARILRKLDAKGIRRTDCSREKYPTIDDYIRQHFKCRECFESLYHEGSDTVECLCKDCVERLPRVNADKKIFIEIKAPEYMTYANGQEGVTLFANLTNRTNAPIKVKLQEFSLTHRNTQKISDFNYNGYNFEEDYLFPDTIKAIGKIWVDEHWPEEDFYLVRGDYCVIILKSSTSNKQYYYKFVYKEEHWSLHDYYELD